MTTVAANRKTSKGPTCSPRNERSNEAHQVAQRVIEREISFISNVWFMTDDATSHLRRLMRKTQSTTEVSQIMAPKVRNGGLVPGNVMQMCTEKLLSAEEEKTLFRDMNLLKCRSNAIRSTINPKRVNRRQLERISRMIGLSEELRDRIVRANVRLVWSIAKQHVNMQHSIDELLSEGLLALVRAVDKFDYDRGFRFSTYTTMVVRRHIYRHLLDTNKRGTRFQQDSGETFIDVEDHRYPVRLSESEWNRIDKHLQQLLTCLDERERFIIIDRFGLKNHQGKKRSLSSLADELGVCKERIRQLEKRALKKLREQANDKELLEFLPTVESDEN